MFSFTLAQSERAKTEDGYKVFSGATLEGLYTAYFSECKAGKKLGSGIIRGALIDVPRCDEHLEYSKLLIIDADGGLSGNVTPTIECCHEALIALGYNHVIYTTFSHSAGFHKYRAIVELNEDIVQHELHDNMSRLIDELRAQGCALKYAHEMNTWSQIWFLPRSENPECFISYLYQDGGTFEAIHVEKSAKAESTENKESTRAETETLDEMFANIRSGKEFHNSLRNISYQLVKDGASRAIVLATLRSLMESSSASGTERWVTRMNEMERLVDGAFERVDEEAQDFVIPEYVAPASDYTPPPIPPKRLGRYITQIMRDMPKPQIEFAFAMGLGSVAAICGAKFNAKTNQFSGLNINMTVVADTGFGKGQISKFYNQLFLGGLNGKIINLAGGDGSASFVGSNNYTAPKPLHRDLMLGRSKVVCMQEAGIMLGAKSGNADELSAYVMENFINSAHDTWSSSRAYSSEENSLKSFRAPAMTMVLESTEESIATSLRNMNAIESGYIPRQTMFKVNAKPKMNRDRHTKATYNFDQDIVSQLQLLIGECAKVQATPDLTPHLVEWPDDLFADLCDLTDHYDNDFTYDRIAKVMASRMAHKVIKFAALAAVFNRWSSGNLMMDAESWAWAKSMGEWEMKHIDHNLSYMREENDYDEALDQIKQRLHAALYHKNTSKAQLEAKVVKRAVLTNRLTQAIKNLAKDRRMPTDVFVDMQLKNLERMGLVKLLDRHKSCRIGVPCIQLLPAFFRGDE